MSGVLTIRNRDDNKVRRISVKNPTPNREDQRKRLLVLLFWLTILFSGLYFLADLTENFTELESIISHFAA